jgi:gliding motility-associated-like protein
VSSNGLFNPQSVTPGNYTFCYTIGSGGCTANDCINVVVNLGCAGDTTTTNETKCPENSVVHNGQTFTNAGTYYFPFTDINGCDSTEVFELTNFNVQNLSQTLNLCEGDSVQVFGAWVYFPDLFEQQEIDANSCEFTRTIIVVGEDCSTLDYNVFVPNTFTPNGDMINDTFEIIVSGGLLEEGYIFNRWGEVIKSFAWDDLTWDGKTKQGLPVVEGVYTYIIYTAPANGNREQKHGFVTVIR